MPGVQQNGGLHEGEYGSEASSTNEWAILPLVDREEVVRNPKTSCREATDGIKSSQAIHQRKSTSTKDKVSVSKKEDQQRHILPRARSYVLRSCLCEKKQLVLRNIL